ncbi:MAG: hypothetical protein KC591_07345, partial [Gemmatimonadetes bacterium]|nr:hypothetical protein [Gemmatimonadota bacterium]
MKRVLPVLLSILFALALLEGALQLVYRVRAGDWLAHRTALPIYRETDWGFALKPHLALEHRTGEFRTHLFTDAHGFRVAAAGEEVAREKPEGTWRVMLLGPSFAFGWGVEYEETFLAQLGDRLRAGAAAGTAAGDAKIDLINAGVPALGPIQQLEWFRREGAAYRPDLVIQLVYGSYAVSRAYSDGLVPDERGYLRPATVSRADRLRAALKRSAIVFHVWAATNRLRGGEPKAIEGAGRP